MKLTYKIPRLICLAIALWVCIWGINELHAFPKVRPKSEHIPENMYFIMRSYGKSHWQKADSIEQIIDYLSFLLAENEYEYDSRLYKEKKQLLNYLTKHKKRYKYLLVNDVAIFLSKDYGYAVESDVFNPCLFEEKYNQKTEKYEFKLLHAWGIAGKRMYDSAGYLIFYDENCLDSIFHLMSKDIGKAFPAEEYNYDWRACFYDCVTEELQNYCTGEAFPAELTNIVRPYLKQIRTIYPNMVLMKFCWKLPVKNINHFSPTEIR